MKRLPFLLEIGTEEIPDWMIEPALKHLEELFAQMLEDQRLDGRICWTDGTPRRLVLRAEEIPEQQPPLKEWVTGPPKSAGEQAKVGFARKNGVEPDRLVTLATPKGEYWAFEKVTAGRPAISILAEELPGLILKIYFPKTMYWTGKNGPRFVRPIRWLVALLGGKVVPFEIAGVRSGRWSCGHRQLGKRRFPVNIGNYEQKLRENFVLVRSSERRSRIEAALEGAVRGEELLKQVIYLTEYPTPIRGNFDEEFLELPEEVLITVMRHHQKYFSIRRQDGRLAPEFIAVMNTADDPEGLIRQGNERVLRARFTDARFFWQVDQQKKLIDRLPELAQVTWQAQLGSYLEKTHRIVELVKELGGSEQAQRAALLSKCDLTTEMVKEFTELQGVMGGLYARAEGEPEAVWRAIYEHYRPESMEDAIPSTLEGRLLSLADKVDTLRGCFGIGLIPSGSKDPFGLRRAAQGVVRILVEGKLRVPLSRLIGENEALREFMLDRVRYYFREIRGFRYDEVNAVVAAGCDDLVDVEERLEALQRVRPTANFEPVAASFKRIRNILRQARFEGGVAIREDLLVEEPERELYRAFLDTRARVQDGNASYQEKLEFIAGLRPVIDRYFDRVLVNAPEEEIRRNRLAMLDSLLKEFSRIADFSEIVVEGNPTDQGE